MIASLACYQISTTWSLVYGSNYTIKLIQKQKNTFIKVSSFGAEGGSRTLMGKPRTILSRVRLPVPPLRRCNILTQKIIFEKPANTPHGHDRDQ